MSLWVQLAIAVVVSVVGYLLSPKPEVAHQAASEDLDVPKLPYGTPYGILQGTVEIQSPGHAWHGDVSAKPIKKKGGKK